MSGLSMRRPHVLIIAASLASVFGGFGGGAGDMQRVVEVRGASAAVVNADPSRPPPAPSRASNNAKLRDLNFFRGGKRSQKHHYVGVRMSVAEGKRRARKVRNRQRHKKQWKRAVR